MKKFLLLIALSLPSFAAIPGGAVWNIRSGATAANANGAFFNPGNTNFSTDGTVDTNTGNTASPVFSSLSYNFVAGDVGAWLYVKSGSDTYPGWYQIASVASNKATLTASTGAGVWHNSSTRIYTISTSAGIASTGTPSSITWGIDYSQSTSALCSPSDMVIDGTTNTDITSATCVFGVRHIGNGLRVASGTGFTAGWYEIASIPSGATARLDRAVGTVSSTGGTGKVGGSASLASGSAPTDDTFFENAVAGNDFFVEAGTYAIGGTVSISAAGNNQNPVRIIGYNAIRGDNPTGSTRPLFNTSTATFTFGQYWQLRHIQVTGTAAPVIALSLNWLGYHVKITNTSSTADRVALSLTAAGASCKRCEVISYWGRAIQVNSTNSVEDSYIHGSKVGILATSSNVTNISGNIISDCTTGISVTAAYTSPIYIFGNTFYGQNQNGTAIDFATGNTTPRIKNNIFTQWATGINHADTTQTSGIGEANLFYANTTNVAGWIVDSSSYTTTDPAFAGANSTLNSTGATSATTVLTAAGGDGTIFNGTITDGVDFLTIISCSGCTTGKYAISSHTDTTLTVSPSIGTASSIVWVVVRATDFTPGSAVVGKGAPGVLPGSVGTSYSSPGAIVRPGSSGTRIF